MHASASFFLAALLAVATTALPSPAGAPAPPCLCAPAVTGNFCNSRSAPGGCLTGACADNTLYTCAGNGTAVPVMANPCAPPGMSAPCLEREGDGNDMCVKIEAGPMV